MQAASLAANGLESILFTDEQIFAAEDVFNKKNEKVYAKTFKDAENINPRLVCVRVRHLAAVMIWCGITSKQL